jgi:rhodanese-related sulfurtransferase
MGETQAPRQTASPSKLCATLDVSRSLRVDGTPASISPDILYARLGGAAAPLLLDVRRPDVLRADGRMIVGAIQRAPDDVNCWLPDLPTGRPVVVYCVHGEEVSRNVAAALCGAGFAAAYLDGGIVGWQGKALPTRRNLGAGATGWVTRERPKIDRIACPWLISRFINPNAEFIYVPASRVAAVAEETGATPYDVDGVEFTHEGDRCSFDTILRVFDIRDPALDRLAEIVRGADTSRHDLAPQCGGLFAISLGLSANFPDDHAMLAHGAVIYDALYTWCRSLQAETHNWPSLSRAAGN